RGSSARSGSGSPASRARSSRSRPCGACSGCGSAARRAAGPRTARCSETPRSPPAYDSPMRIRLLILRTAAPPALALLAACGAPGAAPGDPPAPPAPPAAAGTSPDGLTPEQIEEIYRSRTEAQRGRYTEADVRFMTDMIHHHAQAIEISRLVPDRSERSSIRTLASRIINAQQDEIALMQRWLRDRGRPVPEVHVMDDHVMVHVPGSDAHDPAAHDM